MTIVINAREYRSNYTDNVFGDYCALVQLATKTQHPTKPDLVIETQNWMLISRVGKPPKILTEEESIIARANTFGNPEGLCHAIETSD